jgi:acyl-CoA synthetase (AMP-forming)/AMP-acid ligase II
MVPDAGGGSAMARATSAGGSFVEKIRFARDLPDRPHALRLVTFRNIGDLLTHRAAEAPKAEFLVFYDETGVRQAWTRDEFARQVASVSRLLRHFGIRRGDRVATISHNHADTVVQYFAIWSLGAVAVPINVGEDDRRIRYILHHSETKLAFVRDRYLPRIDALVDELPALQQVVVAGAPRPGRPHCDHVYAEAADSAVIASFMTELGLGGLAGAWPDDDALIVYTSGTTGLPKGVVLSQYNLLVDAAAITGWHGFRTGSRLMCVLPIHHVNGIVVTLLTPLYAGGAVVLNEKFHPGAFFPRVAAEKIEVVSVVPTLLAILLQAGVDPDSHQLSRLRHVICGAGPLTVELARAFEERLAIRVVHGYGLSETTCYSCFLPVEQCHDEHHTWMTAHGFPSIGVPLPVNEMEIHDGEGRALADGERGEIVIRGHNVMAGYFQNDEANEHAFLHGWFRSGDEGFWLPGEDGRRYFFITGRIKELIIRGGVNISPLEIDEVLGRIPGVRAGIAVGFEHDVYGEEVGAYVVRDPHANITEDAIIEACRALLPSHKCPKVVVFGTGVPVTSTGKYQRNRVKPLFSDYRKVRFRK